MNRRIAGLVLVAAGVFAQTPGPSVNMVTSADWPGGDPFLQRQNEPSMAISSRNPAHLLAGSNDYRAVDIPQPPDSGKENGDAWLGVFKSFDGGLTWKSYLLPGYPQDRSPASPLKSFNAAADPAVRAGTNGMFYYGGLAFNRDTSDGIRGTSAIFLTRFIDDNNFEGADSIRYLDTRIVASIDNSHFVDKPAIVVDIPRDHALTCVIPAGNGTPQQSFLGGAIYVSWTQFNGGEDSTDSQIMLTQSLDCGATWSAPVKISGTQKTNQGVALAIKPDNGDLYAVWRVFRNPQGTATPVIDPDAIVGATRKNDNGAISFVQTFGLITPFDEATTQASFRTNAYPAIASEADGTVVVAWSQRGLVPSATNNPARIVLVSGKIDFADKPDKIYAFGGDKLPPVIVVDPNSTTGHQIMPALAFSSGTLTAAWYDFRDDGQVAFYNPVGGGQYTFSLSPDPAGSLPQWGPQGFVLDPLALPNTTPPIYSQSVVRHTVKVRAAQSPKGPPKFQSSVTVSEFAFGTPSSFTNTVSLLPSTIQELEFNPPNLPMFRQGTVPFFGDYIDIAGPVFLPKDDQKNWRFNNDDKDPDYTRVVWTDNRNVVQPADGDWTHYTPVSATRLPSGAFPSYTGLSFFDPGLQRPSCVIGQAGSRNQDIYTAALTPGVVMHAKGNDKPLSPTLTREFPVTVQNTASSTKYYRLSIGGNPPGGVATFVQGGKVNQLDIAIPPQSSASRSVFMTSTNPNGSVPVSAVEITAPNGSNVNNGLTSLVTLNADISNPNIANPNIANAELYNPNIANPNIANPNIANPNIANPNIANPNIANPNIANPNIANPNIANVTVANPNIANPNIANPNIANPNIANPNIANPNIANPNIANAAITDAFYIVTNAGNTAAAYAVKLLQNIPTIPTGVVVQMVASKVYFTPAANGCELVQQPHYVPILNVTSPTFVTNVGGLATSGLPDPATPSFALLPGEQAQVTLRVYDLNTNDPVAALAHFNPTTALTPVVVPFGANTGSSQATLSLIVTTASLPGATSGAGYSPQTLQAVGGSQTGYQWALASGSLPLPAGLALSPAGVLSGTPTVSGTFPIIVKVTDSQANTATKPLTLVVINGNTLQITTGPALPNAERGFPYNFTLTASGGTGALTWSASGVPGLSFPNPNAGTLSGTPSVAGSSTLTITVTDSLSNSISRSYTFIVVQTISITTASLGLAEQGVPYSLQLTSANGQGLVNWIGSSLPAGLSLSAGGLLSGNPTAGTYNGISITATDALGGTATATYSLNVANPLLITNGANLPDGERGVNYSNTFIASGGSGTLTWSASGVSNLSFLNPNAGTVSGIPALAGAQALQVTVTDSLGASVTRSFNLNVVQPLSITTASLGLAEQGVNYSLQLTSANGQGLVNWIGSSLPAGLSLSAGGILSGNPTAGTYNGISITATDALGGTATATYSLNVANPLLITNGANLPDGERGINYSFTFATSGGSGALTWSASGVPNLTFTNPSAGTVSGIPNTAGAQVLQVTVTDSLGASVNRSFNLNVVQPLSITTTSLGLAEQGVNYSLQLTSANGQGLVTWSGISLPTGLTLSTSGLLSGNPTAGTYNGISITATDALGGSATATYSLNVANPLQITTVSMPNGEAGAPYSFTFSSSGGSGSLTWSSSPAPGLSMTNPSAGTLSGTPPFAGYQGFNITVTDSLGASVTKSFSINNASPIYITTPSPSLGFSEQGRPFSLQFTFGNGQGPVTWTANPVPSGLTMSSSGLLSGNPVAGTYNNILVTVTDALGGIATGTYSLSVLDPPVITNSPPASGTVGVSYLFDMASTGGSGANVWTSIPSTPIPGVSFAPLGRLIGFPSTPGTYTFTLTVTDQANVQASGTFTVTIN